MLTVLRVTLYSIAIPALAFAIIMTLSTSNQSLTLPHWQLTHTDIQRAKNILRSNERNLDKLVNLNLTERDLNIACAYLLNLYTENQSQITLNAEQLSFQLRFVLPKNLFGRYIDLQFQVAFPAHQTPRVQNLRFGQINIADQFSGLLLDSVIKYSQLNQYQVLFSQNIKEIQIHPKHLHIKYRLPRQAATQIQNLLTPNIDQQALDQYYEALNHALLKHDPKWRLSLSEILQPLFQLAQQRSTPTTAADENRLAIFIANRYVNHYPSIKKINRKAQPHYSASLYKRTDMAQHFIGSAALAALGSTHFSHLIGVEKELLDAKQGSGFSFIDLAADRAGARFGEYATATSEQALRLQQKMARVKNYQTFMPDIRDLPENLNSTTFKTQYQSIYSPKYQQLLQDIDNRIDASKIYQ